MAVNVALAQGMDWHQLGQMVKAERRAGNPVRGSTSPGPLPSRPCLPDDTSARLVGPVLHGCAVRPPKQLLLMRRLLRKLGPTHRPQL